MKNQFILISMRQDYFYDKKELRFYEGANYVGFKAPDLAADKIWVLPIEDGSTNQVLKTDGSGNLGWTAAGGPATTYSVNTYYADLGGYVIEVRDGGKHGLVVAMQNQALNSGDVMNLYDANSVINDPDYHDVDGDKFMDWRLPTKRELNLMYVHYNSGGNALSLLGASYISSTEYDTNQYWYHNFLNGNQDKISKNTASHVRAVRVF